MEVDLTKFNLTPKQIRLIKLSLAIQKLAEKPYNKLSQKFIADWYCHAAIAAIIIENFDSILLNKENLLTTPENFLSWSRGNQQITDAYQIVFNLAEVPTPAVIHLTNIKKDKEIAFHTILYLGIQNYQFVFFEKVAAGKPFQLSTLDDILKNNQGYYWGFGSPELFPQHRQEIPCSHASAT